jgi:hypothetical protein
MALIPEAVATPAGTATAARLPVNGDTIANLSDRTNLVFNNTSGGSITVTVVGVRPCSQGVAHDLVAVVAAGTQKVIGPIDSRYANAVSGLATVNYTGTLTGTTVYATRV